MNTAPVDIILSGSNIPIINVGKGFDIPDAQAGKGIKGELAMMPDKGAVDTGSVNEHIGKNLDITV